MKICWLFILAVGVLLPMPAPGAPDSPAPARMTADRAPAIPEVTPEELARLAAAATPSRFPDADIALLYDFESIVCGDDALAVTRDDYYIKILTEAGRRQARTQSFHFNTTYNRLDIEILELIRPDGTRTTVNWDQPGAVMIDSGQMSSNIFDPAQRVRKATLPELEVGDIIHIRTRSTELKSRIPGVFSDLILLQSDWPVLKYLVEINLPEQLPLRSIAIKNPVPDSVKFSRREAGGRIIYRWEASDVPQLIPEPDMPELYMSAQRLLVSTAADWKEISSWYYRLCRPRLDASSSELAAKVRELTAGKTGDAERINALFQFVSQQIRYTGLVAESEAPGYEPHDVSATFAWRHGVCRDKAALLVKMLELAGFKAFPALFMAGSPKDDEVPNNFFNHAVVAVELTPGSYQLLDPTFETTSEWFPAALSNQSYLVARPEGDTLRRSPVTPAEQNTMEILTTAKINRNGVMTGESRLDFHGINDLIYRGTFTLWSPERRRNFIASAIQQVLPGARLTSFEITPADLRDMSQPLQVEFSFTLPDSLPEFSREQLIDLPEFGRVFGGAIFLLDHFELTRRRHLLKLPFTCALKEAFSVELPTRSWVRALPPPEQAEIPNQLTFRRRLTERDNRITGEVSLIFRQIEVTPEEYDKFKNELARIDGARRQLPVTGSGFTAIPETDLKREFADSDAVIVNREIDVQVKSGAEWETVTDTEYRVLNYAGVKALSERKIAFNPVWEEVEISGEVISPDGKSVPLAPDAIKLMDASWSAGAPRYPAGKTLVAALPGVEAGSTIRLKEIRRQRDRKFFAGDFFFTENYPIIGKSVRLRLPTGLDPAVSPEPGEIRSASYNDGQHTVLHWKSDSRNRLPDEDFQPPSRLCYPGIMVSSGRMAEFAAALNAELQAKVDAAGPATAALAAELRAGTYQSKQAEIRAIRDTAARRIRAAGPGVNQLPWSCFSAPDVTLESGYGNSADRAILLAALLKAAGIKYEFVAAAPVAYDQEHAKLTDRYFQDIFSEILVFLPDFNCYLNDTSEDADLGATRHEGALGLRLATGRLIAIQPPFRQHTGRTVNCRITFSASGAADLEVEETFRGEYYEKFKRMFREFTPETERQYFEKLLSNLSQSARLAGPVQTDFSGSEAQLKYRIHAPDLLRRIGKYREFELPWFRRLGAALGTVATDRKTPFWRNRPDQLRLNYTIVLPPGFKLQHERAAKSSFGRNSLAEYSEFCHQSADGLSLDCRLQLSPGLVSPQNYVELTELRRRLDRIDTRRLLLVPNKQDKEK